MQELIKLNATPAQIDVNFDELETELEKVLANYQQVVTSDGVKDAKAQATELNKAKQALANYRKETVEQVSAPIREFERRMKALEGRHQEVRQDLLGQVSKFEQEQLDQVRETIREALAEEYQRNEVRAEYQRHNGEDLVKLSAVTSKGSLTKATREQVESIAERDAGAQRIVERRVLELEARSYRAGLRAPLTEDQLTDYLEADDATYEARVEQLIEAELKRQDEADRIETEREQRRAAVAPEPEPEPEEEPEPQPEPEAAPEPEPLTEFAPQVGDDGKVEVQVHCTFTLRVDPGTTREKLRGGLVHRMEEAGFKTLTDVRIEGTLDEDRPF